MRLDGGYGCKYFDMIEPADEMYREQFVGPEALGTESVQPERGREPEDDAEDEPAPTRSSGHH